MTALRNILLLEINPGLFILGEPPLIVLDQAYSFSFGAYGGTEPYQWKLAGSLPTGLSWDAATATISGTTSVPGFFPVTVSIKDAQRVISSKAFTLEVQVLPMMITNAFADYTAGVSQSFTYTSSGGAGTKSWAVTSGALPDGLSMDSSGHITGNTTGLSVGTHTFTYTVTVTGSVAGSADLDESVTVTVAAISITNAAPDGQSGVSYSHTYTSSGGTGTKTWSKTGTLPTSLSLSSGGVLSGTPSADGTFTPTIIVTDNAGTQASLPESIVIAPPAVVVTWNPADKNSNFSLSSGNLIATRGGGSAWGGVRATTSVDAATANHQYQFVYTDSQTIAGVAASSEVLTDTNYPGITTGYVIYMANGQKIHANGFAAYGATPSVGDLITILLKNGKLYCRVNTTWMNGADPNAETGYAFSGITGDVFPILGLFTNGSSATGKFSSADQTTPSTTGTVTWGG